MLRPSNVDGAAADLVEDDEASRRGAVQDVRGLLHLDHERGLPASDVVGCADAREDAVDERDLRVLRRHERPGLREQRQQRSLAQVGRLAAHVRSGQDHELPRAAVQVDVVRDERVAGEALDDRMARIGRQQLVAVVHVRLGEVGDRRRFSQAGEHVERGQGPRRVLDARRLGGDLIAKRREDLQLPLENPLIRPKHLLFVFLQRRRREALAAGNRLLALVIVRHAAQVRFRDLDVVAEHAIETHLERTDAGPRALPLFHRRNHLAAGSADALEHHPAPDRRRRG